MYAPQIKTETTPEYPKVSQTAKERYPEYIVNAVHIALCFTKNLNYLVIKVNVMPYVYE